jgi:hypothetical protein
MAMIEKWKLILFYIAPPVSFLFNTGSLCYGKNFTYQDNGKDSMSIVAEDTLSLFKYSNRGRRSLSQVASLPFMKNKNKIDQLTFSGIVDFISFYRVMSIAYPDMGMLRKNIEFTPYPITNQANGNYYRQPLINLIISGAPSVNTSFAIEYVMSHFFTGQTGDTARKLSVQNMLQFHGNVKTAYGNFLLSAGGGAINYSISPFTMYNKDFREPLFEKLPWDWYTNSFQKYKEQFRTSSTTVPTYLTNTATQGFILEGSNLPAHFGFSAFYGRSNYTITPDRANAGYPTQLIAGKLYKGSDSTGKVGLNIYDQAGFTDRVKNIKDQRKILTLDFLYNSSKIRIYSEVGYGVVQNPSNQGKAGEAINAGLTVFNNRIRLPVQLQVYSIDKNVAALESAVLNANASVSQGGYASDPIYNNGYYPAYLQEVNMMANNRQGIIFRLDKVFNNFRIEFGNAVSREKENILNAVSFEHMVNAFSRSRFRPWYQGAGPYRRISNRYRRSFETIRITDTLTPYIKYFNASELTMKLKMKFLKRGLIISNYCYAGSSGKNLSPIPVFNPSSFVRVFYEEVSAYYNVHDKLTLLGFYGIQRNIANTQTELSIENHKPLNQLGTGYGFGIDYDFAPSAGLFIRYRWMQHKDYNFFLDKFKGQETIVELKIFF